VDIWRQFCEDEAPNVRIDTPEQETAWISALELGEAMLNGYFDLYGHDESWDVIATEQTFKRDIRYGPRDKLAYYVGTVDGVYRDLNTDEIWLMEHKTAKAIQTMHLALDDQAGSYYAVATDMLREQGLIKQDEVLNGIMYNFLRKGLPDDRSRNEDGLYLNKNGSISKVQPSPLFHREPVWKSVGEKEGMLRNIRNELTVMDQFRTQELFDGLGNSIEGSPQGSNLPLYKNPTRDCFWDCSFYRMCQLHEAGEDWEEFAASEFTTKDPYADHDAHRKSS
jgi:hypothetical protein